MLAWYSEQARWFPVLAWNFQNAVLISDAGGNVRLSKKHSRERIDGAVAAAMAFGGWLEHRDDNSIYENRDGILLI